MIDPVILYVEDDLASCDIMRLMLEEILNLHQFTIWMSSENFTERLDALPQPPTVFLLDIHVPPFDGFAMLSMLRQHPRFRAARVIALTASVMNEEVSRLRTAGFDSVIAKPIDMDTFPDRLHGVLNGESVWTVGG